MLIQDEEQFLSSPQCKDWEQAFPTALDNLMDELSELILSLVPLLMDLHTIGTLDN